MNIIDIIEKKAIGLSLSYEELAFAFNGYLNKSVEDYQMSSLLMAITIKGMDSDEVNNLTDIFIKSGKSYNVEKIFSDSVDKHSTGGVGDSTTLIIGPIVASLGLKMIKMSGRRLGLTGGTIDKLESIPNFKVNLSKEELFTITNKTGFALSSQTDDLTPLDKLIYTLRDVTGTTKSLPLIAVSIMSKKIALGAKYILIDIKYGSGALIKDKDEANVFSKLVENIGTHFNKTVKTIISSMDTPLSYAIGNAVEVLEVKRILNGASSPLLDKSIEISANLVSLVKNIPMDEAEKMCKEVIDNKSALNKFKEFVSNQGGNLDNLKVSNKFLRVKATHSGVIKKLDAKGLSKLAFKLGCGRLKKDDEIDYSVGIMLNKHINDYIKKDETLMYLYVNDENITFNEEDFDFIEIEGK